MDVEQTTLSLAENFASRLRAAREAIGMSTSKLAGAVNVTDGAIRQMESGQTKSASFAIGLRIARALGVTPEYLAGEPEPTGDLRICLDDAVVHLTLAVHGREADQQMDQNRAKVIRSRVASALSAGFPGADVVHREAELVRVMRPDFSSETEEPSLRQEILDMNERLNLVLERVLQLEGARTQRAL